jgi:hypothetical protein
LGKEQTAPPDQGRRGLCEKASDACHDATAANPVDYTPIVQREMNPRLKIPLRFELMTQDFKNLFVTISCAGKPWPGLEPKAKCTGDEKQHDESIRLG